MPKPGEKREEHEQLEDLVPELNVFIANCFYVVKQIFCMAHKGLYRKKVK